MLAVSLRGMAQLLIWDGYVNYSDFFVCETDFKPRP
jgi:hypothetical protein